MNLLRFVIGAILFICFIQTGMCINCPSSTYTSEPSCSCGNCSGCGLCKFANGTAYSECINTDAFDNCIEWRCNYSDDCECEDVPDYYIDPDPGECDDGYCLNGACESVVPPSDSEGSCPTSIECGGPCSCSSGCSCSATCWDPTGIAIRYCCKVCCGQFGCHCCAYCCDYSGCYCDEVPRCGTDEGCKGHCDGRGCCDDQPPTLNLIPLETQSNEWINYSLDVTFSCTDPDDQNADDGCCSTSVGIPSDSKCTKTQWCVMKWGVWGKYDLENSGPSSCSGSWSEVDIGDTITLDDHTYIILKGEDINCNSATSVLGPYEYKIDKTYDDGETHSWCEPPLVNEWVGSSVELTFNFYEQGDSGPDKVGFGYYLIKKNGDMYYYEDPEYWDCFPATGPSHTDGGVCDPDVTCNSNTKAVHCQKTIIFDTAYPPLGGECGDACDYVFSCVTTRDTAGNPLNAYDDSWGSSDPYTAADQKSPYVWLSGTWGGGEVTVYVNCRDNESGCNENSYRIYVLGSSVTEQECNNRNCVCTGSGMSSPQTFTDSVCVAGYAEDNVDRSVCSCIKV